MSRKDVTMLILPIKKQWFDMIISGEKKEEYREIKPYYYIRFKNADMFPDPLGIDETHLILDPQNFRKYEIMFRNGYSAESTSFIAKVYLTTDFGKPEWGAEPGIKYYVLHIEEIVGTYKCNSSMK